MLCGCTSTMGTPLQTVCTQRLDQEQKYVVVFPEQRPHNLFILNNMDDCMNYASIGSGPDPVGNN